jgi:DNA-binding NarL/FixJ family response regulator
VRSIRESARFRRRGSGGAGRRSSAGGGEHGRPRVLVLTTFDLDAAGEALLAPTVTRRLIHEFARQRPRTDDSSVASLATLTPRETQVLRLIAEGLSNPEIAARFTVTEETVKTHVSRILAKLGLRDRTQAVVAAYESGLVVAGSRDA